MSNQIPWWTWTAPLWPTLLVMAFVLVAGWLQGHTTGRYPTLREFVQALRTLQPLSAEKPPPPGERPAALNGQQTAPPGSGPGTVKPREHPAEPPDDLTSR